MHVKLTMKEEQLTWCLANLKITSKYITIIIDGHPNIPYVNCSL